MRFSLIWLTMLSSALPAHTAGAQDLPAAIADALAHTPAMDAATAGERAAQARLDQARAERNLLLRVEGTVGTGRIDPGGYFGLSVASTTPLAVQATAEMPVWTGGRIGAAIAQARGGKEIARLQAEQTRTSTIVQAVSSYVGVLTSRLVEQQMERTATALAEVVRQAELRFKAGDIALSDLAQARSRGAEAEAGLAEAQGRRLAAEAAYARLTGKTPGALAPLPALPPVPSSLDEALDQARQANPMLRQVREATRVAKAAGKAARAEGLPSVGLFSEAAHIRDQFFPGYKADSVAVGLRGRWTLFAGGRVAAQIRAADAESEASLARERSAGEALDGMVIDAWQSLRTAGQVSEASALRALAAAEALRSVRLEARVGAKPTLAVLDAERDASAAEAARIDAEGQRLLAAWQLHALTGHIAE